ncbi:MAG: aminoglycoside phosphotransferase, partial [Clostridia bacterium]
TGTSKKYVQEWLPIVAAAQLTENKESERELLMKWIDVVAYE